jgi:hypothetical protein
MKKKKILLPTKKFFKSEEEDLNISLNLDTKDKLLREGDRDIILNISDLFDDERNNSNNYKIYGKIRMIYRNMYSGTTTYSPLVRHLYVSDENSSLNEGFLSYNEYGFIRNDTLHEVNNITHSSIVPIIPIDTMLKGTEYTGHTVTTNFTAPYKNWNLYLSYVYGQDENYPMTYTLTGGTKCNFVSGTGIPFRIEQTGKTYKLTSPVEHGMSVGEYIVLSGDTLSGLESGRTFNILTVGDETHNSEKYVLEIPNVYTITSTIVIGKRCLDPKNISGTSSKYYVHKHKTISDVADYIIDNAGFEKSIWEEERKILFENALSETDVLVERNRMESLLYDFKEPFVLKDILNNLGYTPTEVYVTVINRNGNGYFNYPPKVGYKFNFHNTWMDEHFNGSSSEETTIGKQVITTNTTGYTFTGGTELNTGTTLVGAFVEYNESEMKERIISESFHKITLRPDVFNHGQTGNVNMFTGATPTNPFGFYYQTHYRVKLRQLSPYIETSDTDNVYNLPENTKYNELEKVWKWRDLYDHGYVDPDGFGTNYPFTNNTHYVKNDINFYFRNERYFTNKKDGITNFNNRRLKIC